MKAVRWSLVGALTAGAFGFAPCGLEAQALFGVNGNFGTETDFGIGGRVHLGLSRATRGLEAMGSFEIFFPDGPADYWEVNANVFYALPVESATVLPYVGGGLNIGHTDVGEFDSTEVGLNLAGGVRFPGTSVTPFVEARAVISNRDQLVLTAGVLFGNPSRL